MAIENDTSDKLITLDNLAVFQEEIDARKQDTLVSGTNIKTINSQSVLGSGNIEISAGATSVEITYSELKALRDGGNLVPGQQYRITDYQCTTVQTNTSSAGHQFDIIVTADSTNKLNEVARACLHSGDTYFASNKLEAWQLWYCLDNDTTRFAWADSTNGKGVVYRMIDEFNNDVPYDFKNILFTSSGKYTNAYTFTYTENSTIKDASLLGISKSCYGNTMKEYISFSSHKQQLNFNVFYSYDDSSGWYSNIVESNCYSNTFNFDCFSNKFGAGCYSNTFGYECHSNTLGNNCHNNTFGDELFGGNCYYNTFGDDCYSNTFGNSCFSNTFGDNCYSNTFGFMCFNNTFGNGCNGNTVGNYCRYNTFGNDCVANKFGDSSSVINYCENIIMDNGCGNLYIKSTDTSASSSNYLQNVHIHLGVKGTPSSKKTITISDRNLSYETNVYIDANGNIEQIVNGGIIPAINADY